MLSANDPLFLPELDTGFDVETFREIHIDIGCGRGGFLLEAAAQFPDTGFIGVDINAETLRIVREETSKTKNARVLLCEGFEFISTRAAPQSIDGIHVYFPTPYINPLLTNDEVVIKPEGRLLTYEFFAVCRSVLKPGRYLRIVTDKSKYLNYALNNALKAHFTEVPWVNLMSSTEISLVIGTGCEKEMRSRGQSVFTLMLV